ncbi:helix-turn-helix domain-containing protein [Vibrio campbellii]
MFGEIIRKFRKESGLSQLEFVSILQKSSNNFDNLDVVTLSRWERGVTKPHLNRQNEMLDMLGVDIFDVWSSANDVTELPDYTSRINKHGYFNEIHIEEIDFITLNSSNADLVDGMMDVINVIFDFEKNIVFNKMENQGFSRKSIISNILCKYNGELTIALKNGQLLAHILTVDYNIFEEYFESDMCSKEKYICFILSFNCSHVSSLVETLGKVAYQYVFSLNPGAILIILVNNAVSFNLLYSLDLEYQSIGFDNFSSKIMTTNIKSLKSQKVWMNILSQYKEKEHV